MYVHENLDARTHDRLAELIGANPLWIIPHLRQAELARAMVRWNTADDRYRALPENALDHAGKIDCPVLLVSGSKNGLWLDSNQLCHDVLAARQPQLDVRYVEIPGYGHLDVFGYILDFLAK